MPVCHQCGSLLKDRYIRSGNRYFCSLKLESDGYVAPCFESWVRAHYPAPIADYAVIELRAAQSP